MESPSLEAKLSEIEAEMKRLGFWREAPPAGQQRAASAFGIGENMTFEQWLQFTFLPSAREAIKTSQLPSCSQVAAQAVREFDGFDDTSRLVGLLSDFDRAVESNAAPVLDAETKRQLKKRYKSSRNSP